MKQTIRLNENQFNRLIKESVKRVLNEYNPHLRDLENDDDFEDYNDYRKAQVHNRMWDDEEEENITDLKGLRVFKPSEEWEMESNEENFMGGRNDDEDDFRSLKEYVGNEIIDMAKYIVERCQFLMSKIEKNMQDEDAYFDEYTSFFVDEKGIAWARVNVGNFEIRCSSNAWGGYFIEGETSNKKVAYGGSLSYNQNIKEGKRLFIVLIETILSDCLYGENYYNNSNSYADFIKNSPKVLNAIKQAYNAIVKIRRTLISKYGKR